MDIRIGDSGISLKRDSLAIDGCTSGGEHPETLAVIHGSVLDAIVEVSIELSYIVVVIIKRTRIQTLQLQTRRSYRKCRSHCCRRGQA